MVITLLVADRIKPVFDEGSWMVLTGGSFEVTCVGNIESAGPGEVDPLGNSEGTMVYNKIGIYYGEVLGIALVLADRINIGDDD